LKFGILKKINFLNFIFFEKNRKAYDKKVE
jgi:hypothetical protein